MRNFKWKLKLELKLCDWKECLPKILTWQLKLL